MRGWTRMAAVPATWTSASPAILVVEDNTDLLVVLGMLLDYEHLPYVPAADGNVALDRLAEARPSLVILDWRLPQQGGPGLLAAIRKRYGARVPVLVLSAVADGEQARAAGADAFLRKPYVVEELVEKIRLLVRA